MRHAHAHRPALDADLGFLRAAAIVAIEGDGPDAIRALRQGDDGAGRLDRHVPLVAGDVPVELVVVLEEPEPVHRPVVERDGAGRVLGAGHPDLELLVVAGAAALELERRAVGPGRRGAAQPEGPVESLRRAVVHRHRAIDPVPLPAEARRDRLGDVDAAICVHHDAGGELLDGECALRRRRGHGGEQGERGKPGSPHDCLPRSMPGTAASDASDSPKNSRGRMPKGPAIRLEGNCATFVLRSRTTAL